MRHLSVALAAATALFVNTACAQAQPPTPADAGSAATSAEGTAPPNLTSAPQRDVDWSAIEKDPLVTSLSHWDDVTAVNAACVRGDASARCVEMRRRLKRVGDESEVHAAMAQVNLAVPLFTRLWSAVFMKAGKTFVPPTVKFYAVGSSLPGVFARAEIPTDCLKELDNAFYCWSSHTVYIDAVYLARVAAAVRETDGTSGRYAALTVAAHEIGHSVIAQVTDQVTPYQHELLADCFAGAALATVPPDSGSASQATRVLNGTSALKEGQLGLYLIGGPKMVDGVHEAGPVRADYFTRGFNLGVVNCVEAILGN